MSKRKFRCCELNEKYKKKNVPLNWHCDYCQCLFSKKNELDGHVSSIHKCKCGEIVLTEDERLQHQEMHKREDEKALELKRKQEEVDDAFVVNFVIPKKLDEYTPEPGHKHDFDYIFNKYYKHIGKEEVLYMVTKLEMNIGDFCEDEIGPDDVIYLLETGAVSEEVAADWLDSHSYIFDGSYEQLIDYFLEKEFKIKVDWVARLIEYDKLIERIKSKFQFTFEEIYDARDDFFDNRARDYFYVNVHKHFPDPDFEDPFKDPFEEYKCVSTEHVDDYLHNRYWYDEEDDELSIVVGEYLNKRQIELGECKQMMERDLEDLIREYKGAINDYKKANDEVSKLFDEKDEIEEKIEDDRNAFEENKYMAFQMDSGWCNVMDDIHKIALPERNACANIVAKLYFVISKK